MPATALTLDLDTMEFVHGDEPDVDGLDEFLEHECGLKKNGACDRAGSRFCEFECPENFSAGKSQT